MMLTVRRRLRVIAHSAVSLVLVACVVLATLTLSTVNALSSSAMSCCPPGFSDHCNVALMAKLSPPPEPMCGLDTAVEKRVGANFAPPRHPSQVSPETSKTPALKAPCSIDCCAFAQGNLKRPNIDLRGLVPRKSATQGLTYQSKAWKPQGLVLKSESFDKTIPRGPPQLV